MTRNLDLAGTSQSRPDRMHHEELQSMIVYGGMIALVSVIIL
jgi:hypothetical protein